MFDASGLRRRRAALGLSLAELAERVGCSTALVSHLETGHTRDPRASTLFTLARALGCGPEELFAGERSESRRPPITRRQPRGAQ